MSFSRITSRGDRPRASEALPAVGVARIGCVGLGRWRILQFARRVDVDFVGGIQPVPGGSASPTPHIGLNGYRRSAGTILPGAKSTEVHGSEPSTSGLLLTDRVAHLNRDDRQAKSDDQCDGSTEEPSHYYRPSDLFTKGSKNGRQRSANLRISASDASSTP
jgi:hypothetical protein